MRREPPVADHQSVSDPCGYLAILSDYIDGQLNTQVCHELEHHMAGCENCRIVVDTLRRTVDLYHTTAHTELPAEVEQRLWRRFELDDLLQSVQEMNKE